MSGRGGPLHRLVVVDSRSPDDDPVRGLLAAAAAEHEVHLVSRSDLALEVVGSSQPSAVLVHAGVEPRVATPAAGPLLAAAFRRFHPSVPILLYTGNPRAGHERLLAQGGVPWPVVVDRRLLESFTAIVGGLVEYAGSTEVIRRTGSAVDGVPEVPLPSGLRVQAFIGRMAGAVLRAALCEHASRTQAAAAVGLSAESFDRELGVHGLQVPRSRRPDSSRGPSLLWCSSTQPPPVVVQRCEAFGQGVREVAPGTLHPVTIASIATTAALLDPADAPSAVDAWLLQRAERPVLLSRPPPIAVQYVLAALCVGGLRVAGPDQPPQALLQAGRHSALLYRDEQVLLRMSHGQDGRLAWPLDLRDLEDRVRGLIVGHARRTTRTIEEAAAAVGLSVGTFRRRLNGVERGSG